jgi:hypothetical protein
VWSKAVQSRAPFVVASRWKNQARKTSKPEPMLLRAVSSAEPVPIVYEQLARLLAW